MPIIGIQEVDRNFGFWCLVTIVAQGVDCPNYFIEIGFEVKCAVIFNFFQSLCFYINIELELNFVNEVCNVGLDLNEVVQIFDEANFKRLNNSV